MSLLADVGKKQKAEKTAAHKEVEKVTLAKEDVELVVCLRNPDGSCPHFTFFLSWSECGSNSVLVFLILDG